jgi:hypothetical protein
MGFFVNFFFLQNKDINIQFRISFGQLLKKKKKKKKKEDKKKKKKGSLSLSLSLSLSH